MVADKPIQLGEHGDTSPVDYGSLLVVDDNEMNRDMLSRRLKRCGYSVSVAAGGTQAMECLEQRSFDAVLLDIMMPVVNGWDVLSWIRERHSREQLPVIMVTAKDTSEDIVRALDLGANDYVTKPFDLKVVRARVEALVGLKRTTETLVAANGKLEDLVRHDALTGALNRTAFSEMFQKEWQRSSRYQRPLSCVMLDIDFFKRINDTYGHASGDRVLTHVADLLRQNIRASSLVGRFGGEEFCILLTETNEQEAAVWCERVRQNIAEALITVDSQDVSVTASIGVASYSNELPDPQQMLEQADEAMFIAKRTGRNRVVSFDRHCEPGDNDQELIWNGLTIEELMVPHESFVALDSPLGEAIGLLQAERVESVSVLNADGTLSGVIGEDEIIAASLADSFFTCTAEDAMKAEFVSFSIETPVREVCEFFCRDAARQVFVLDGKRPLGVIRRADFLQWIRQAHLNTPPCTESLDFSLA